MKDLTIVDESIINETQKAADAIDKAVEAYRNRTPDSIKVFRALTHADAEVVIRILKMTARGPKKAKP